MKCKKAIKTYFELDNKESLPPALQDHILECPTCGKFINFYQNSLSQIRKNKHSQISQTKIDSKDVIMNKIQKLNIPQPHTTHSKISKLKWITAGLLIIAGFACIPFSQYFKILIEYFGANLELPLFIVMGCAITIYSAIFVATHSSIFNSKTIEKFFRNSFINFY